MSLPLWVRTTTMKAWRVCQHKTTSTKQRNLQPLSFKKIQIGLNLTLITMKNKKMTEVLVCNKRPCPHESLMLYRSRQYNIRKVPLIISKCSQIRMQKPPDRLTIIIICQQVIFIRVECVQTMHSKMRMMSTIKKFHRTLRGQRGNMWNKIYTSCKISDLKTIALAIIKMAKKWGHSR